jgi:outer membrane protein TolC
VQATEALLKLKAAHEKVLVARDAVTAAREGLRIVTNQYREGLASMVDLLDTQAAATMAEGNLVQARHDYHVGLANLEFAGAVPVGMTAVSGTDTQPAAGQ